MVECLIVDHHEEGLIFRFTCLQWPQSDVSFLMHFQIYICTTKDDYSLYSKGGSCAGVALLFMCLKQRLCGHSRRRWWRYYQAQYKSFNACFTFLCECGWVGHTQPRVRLRALCAPQRAPVLRKRHIWIHRTTRRLAAFTTATILLLELYSYAETGESVIWWTPHLAAHN